MSGAAGDDLPPVEMARKLRRYGHLMPMASAQFIDKVQSGSPPSSDADAAEAELVVAPPMVAPPIPVWPKLDAQAARARALGCMLGLAVGDAVGTAVESKPRDSFRPLKDMVGGGPFKLAAGEWTDDTTMALCLAESLLSLGGLDQEDLMERFQRWLEHGENTVPGRCFDIGATTRAAIQRFMADGFPAAGSSAPDTAGNGSLVRLAPLAIFCLGQRELGEILAQKQSYTTHAAKECIEACRLFMTQLLDALDGADKDAATRPRVMSLAPKVLFINAGEWRSKTRDQISSSSYVVNTLEAALWSVWQTDNFRDAVLTAANLGDDAGSVAAVAGQLAGALYGVTAIPPQWLAKLAWRDKVEKLASDLFDRSSIGR
jgi:ADP-ribosyl-[dinitrogen reductase] hydrolase